MEYDRFKYIYPPRPAIVSTVDGLKTYEKRGWVGQAKLNGSCAEVYTDKSTVKFMGRDGTPFVRQIIKTDDLLKLHRGRSWITVTGEFMNKSKRDGKGKIFNGAFVIFGLVVYNGKHLIGSTFRERQAILDDLYGEGEHFDEYINYISPSVYRVRNFEHGFEELYKKIIKVDMYEGLVLKNPDGKLEFGTRPVNNTGWMVKIRKPTKNYSR